MKPSAIKVGVTYVNKGAGRTQRKVLAIGKEHCPKMFFGDSDKVPNEPGVLYEQAGFQNRLYLSSFAQWCGKAVSVKEQ